MMNRMKWLPLIVILASASAPGDASADVAEQAYQILEKHCFGCHGPKQQKSGLRLDTLSHFRRGGDSGESLYAEGDLPGSHLWVRVGVDRDMPPEGKPQPSSSELNVLKQWLLEGAKFPSRSTDDSFLESVFSTTQTVQSAKATESVAQEDQGDLGAEAYAVLKRHCYRCHGQQQKTPGLDVGQLSTMTDKLAGKTNPLVVRGSSSTSLLWKKVDAESMPPKNQPRLSLDEKSTLARWINGGAPAFPDTATRRPFVSELDVQTAIRDYLRKTSRVQRSKLRFFTMHHLHNNESVTEAELRLYKAALAKLINSLTWESEIVVPQAVDSHHTVFAVDLRDLDWTERSHWDKVLAEYPYGLEYDSTEELRELGRDIRGYANNSLQRIRIRGDWFVAKASRPPLYNRLLEIPEKGESIKELDEQLEVEIEQDFLDSDLMRAGIIRSRISSQNRLLDRYRSLHGAYWKSYDFSSNVGQQSLLTHPLGPDFEDNPFRDQAVFKHAGGEIVFSLPNRLNGYLLVDESDIMIDEGPISIVRDANEISGSPAIVTGLSCIACHKNGFVRFEDDIRGARSVAGEAREKVEELFATRAEMNARLLKDEYHFLNAMLLAVGPFLDIKTIEGLRDFPEEPVGALTQYFNSDLDVIDLAAELGIKDSDEFLRDIRGLRITQILGPVRNGGAIRRDFWESLEGQSNSNFQTIAEELEIAFPVKLN